LLTGATEDAIRAQRKQLGLVPSYRLVDTCAAEFEAYKPYYYSTYDRGDDEVKGNTAKKVMILGGGPKRIGQGIEFDYCCVHAAFALKEDGFETIMVNSNPETVSTDYDTSDKLFFEPLMLEDVLHIYEREKCWGAIAQFGGQTPLNLALGLQANGVNIIGISSNVFAVGFARSTMTFREPPQWHCRGAMPACESPTNHCVSNDCSSPVPAPQITASPICSPRR
jgi:carbamoyl-phosphate synthase large subunit